MSNLTRRAAFDDFFNDYFGKVLFMPPFAYPGDLELTIKIDVKEAERDFTVLAEIPGVNKEDIAVEIDGNTVWLRAEVKRDTQEQDDERTIYSERSYGYVARSFSLPAEVDEATVSAEYKNGVLRLTLPKKAGAAGRRVAVS